MNDQTKWHTGGDYLVNKHLNKALCKICLKTLDGGDPPTYGLDKSSLGDEIHNALKFWKHLLRKNERSKKKRS